MSKTKHKVLARRYRPQTFCDVVGQETIVTTLKNALRFDKIAHAYLFCGSRGVGKTTLARLFAKALNCEEKTVQLEPCNRCSSCLEITAGQSLDVIEIDGASNRGIDDIRQINETVVYAPSANHFKIYIIDEVHMLTKEAFNALLKTLEEPPERVKFFFATTEPHKVLPTIISRCQRFDLGRIPLSQMIAKLEQIALDLGRIAEPEALHLIASFSDGSLRDAESLFDQILCFASETVTAEAVRQVLGLISQDYFFSLDRAFSECKIIYAFELVESLFSAGKDLAHFYQQLIEHVRWITLAKTMGEKGLTLPPELAAKYLESARLYTSAQCLYLLDYLLKHEQLLQKSVCQRVSVESALLHYIQSKNRIPVETLVRKLVELEEQIKNKDVTEPQKPEIIEAIAILPPAPPSVDLVKPPQIEAPIAPQKSDSPISLKNRDFGKEAPQNFNLERTTVAERQGVSENQNSEAKPMPSKTDSPASSCIHHPSHYDTLIRFAAVELEGTVKK